jgi:DNA-binding GntR family transcriptional regulator
MEMRGKNGNTTHEIYTSLFDRIIHNQYPPDLFLREDGLAKEFSISRTPIRNVLKRLEQDQLIEIIPNRGARIYTFTADDLEDIYEIRKSLEVLALRFALPVLSIQKLIEIRKKVQRICEKSDYLEHSTVDAELHSYLIESSGRRRLINMLNQLYHLIQTFRELGFKDTGIREITCTEHLELIDALCVRDSEGALGILENHIQSAKVRVLSKVVQGQLQ